MFINFLFLALLLAVAALIITAWKIADTIIKSPRELRPEDWDQSGLQPEFVRFPATDGVSLAGAFVRGTNRGTIILMHGYSHSKTQLIPQAMLLHAAGFNVFLFDFRGSGESGGEFITFGQEETRDFAGAVQYLHSRKDVDHNHLGVFGYSMGGSVALLQASAHPEIQALVIDSSYAEFKSLIQTNFAEYASWMPFFPLGTLVLYIIKVRTGAYLQDVQPLAHVAKLRDVPLLLIHGRRDKTVPVWDAVRVQAIARGPAELLVVEGAGHTGTRLGAGEKYIRKVVGFFSTHLLE